MRGWLLEFALLGGAAEAHEAKRTRVAIGPQVVPRYPGADSVGLRPFFDLSRARGDDAFAFEAPDESTGFAFLHRDGLAIGPSLGFEGARNARDVAAAVPRVGFTVEAGGFVQYQLTGPIRLRAELRKGIGGHRGLIGNGGVDYVMRDGDRWLVSIGPRVTLSDARYHRAYFGTAPGNAAGLPAFDAKGGVQAAGVTTGVLRQLTPSWGVYGYAKYDRLVADPARSPIVRGFGSRDQASGGVTLTYTFGGLKPHLRSHGRT